MKKIILLFALILSVFLGNAQVKNITIKWKTDVYGVKKNTNGLSKTIPKKNEGFSQSIMITKDAMRFEAQWKDNGLADVASLQVSDIKYGSISSKDLGSFDSKLTTTCS